MKSISRKMFCLLEDLDWEISSRVLEVLKKYEVFKIKFNFINPTRE